MRPSNNKKEPRGTEQCRVVNFKIYKTGANRTLLQAIKDRRRRFSANPPATNKMPVEAGSGTGEAVRLKLVNVPKASRLSPNWMSDIPLVKPERVNGLPVANTPFR